MRKIVLVFILMAMVASQAASAESMLQVKPVSQSGNFTSLSSLAFDPFDSSLGELTQAVFTAQLNLTYMVNPVVVTDTNGVPVPAVIGGQVAFDIDGLNWPFLLHATIPTNFITPSVTPHLFTANLDLTWNSGATSDLLGFTLGSGSFAGAIYDPINPVHRSDYIATPATEAAGLLFDVRSISGVTSSTGLANVGISGGGFIQLQYIYTPVAVIPEPEIYAMLGVGLGLMGWVGRRRKLQAA